MIKLESSHGYIMVDADNKGLVDHQASDYDATDEECYLKNIHRVDIEEVDAYCQSQDLGKYDMDGDILDVGFWDKDGTYQEPSKSWREGVFLNINNIKE